MVAMATVAAVATQLASSMRLRNARSFLCASGARGGEWRAPVRFAYAQPKTHRSTTKGPFLRLRFLRSGDELVRQSLAHNTHRQNSKRWVADVAPSATPQRSATTSSLATRVAPTKNSAPARRSAAAHIACVAMRQFLFFFFLFFSFSFSFLFRFLAENAPTVAAERARRTGARRRHVLVQRHATNRSASPRQRLADQL